MRYVDCYITESAGCVNSGFSWVQAPAESEIGFFEIIGQRGWVWLIFFWFAATLQVVPRPVWFSGWHCFLSFLTIPPNLVWGDGSHSRTDR